MADSAARNGADDATLALRALAAYIYDSIDRGEQGTLATEAAAHAGVDLRLPDRVVVSREYKMPKVLVVRRPTGAETPIAAVYRYNPTADKLQRIG